MPTPATPPTTFAALWEDLKTEALNLWQSVKNEATAIEASLVPTIEADVVLGLSQFKSFALNMVMTLAGQEFANLTGAQKNVITAASIVATAKTQGTVIVAQDAQLLAQQAYQGLASTVSTIAAAK